MPCFDAQRGRPDGPGSGLPGARHFAAGHNPYVPGAALPADSPVFCGREVQLHAICARVLSPDKPQSVSPPETTQGWLADGWSLLTPFRDLAAALPEYRRFPRPETRRRFLEGQADLLSRADWSGLPEYWGNLARELAAHRVDLLRAEAAQALEWLRILVVLPPQRLHMGQQTLIVRVRNESAAAARGLRLRVEKADAGLHCAAADLAFPIPLEPGQETRLQIPFSCARPGTYLVRQCH